MDYSPLGSSAHRILQARILEWLSFPSPGDLPNPGIKPALPASPAWQVDSLPLSHLGSPNTYSVQFSSVTQSCLTLCNPMNCSVPGLPVHLHLLECTQTHVHQVGDAFQLSHPPSSSSPPAPTPPSIRVSSNESTLLEVAKLLEFQL